MANERHVKGTGQAHEVGQADRAQRESGAIGTAQGSRRQWGRAETGRAGIGKAILMCRAQQPEEAAVEVVAAFGVGIEHGTEVARLFQRIEADGGGLCMGTAGDSENGSDSGRSQEGHRFQNSILSR
ncbi:hypothetical protein D3C81_1843930 [compost metagenome]